jgi:predicted histidine transporter YuiF (NhaC family)
MHKLENWKAVLTKAWSMRFMALSALCSGVAVALGLLPGFTQLTLWKVAGFAGAAVAFNLLGMWARLVAQKGVTDTGASK